MGERAPPPPPPQTPRPSFTQPARPYGGTWCLLGSARCSVGLRIGHVLLPVDPVINRLHPVAPLHSTPPTRPPSTRHTQSEVDPSLKPVAAAAIHRRLPGNRKTLSPSGGARIQVRSAGAVSVQPAGLHCLILIRGGFRASCQRAMQQHELVDGIPLRHPYPMQPPPPTTTPPHSCARCARRWGLFLPAIHHTPALVWSHLQKILIAITPISAKTPAAGIKEQQTDETRSRLLFIPCRRIEWTTRDVEF